jgi:N-acetylneuraminate synthase
MNLQSTVTQKAMIIGEVAQSHHGSLGLAHAFIDAIADAGADAVKFQTHIAAAESTVHEPWRVKFSRQDATRYDYWKRMEFPRNIGWAENMRTIEASSFSVLPSKLWVASESGGGLKVASGRWWRADVCAMAASQLPIILSSGMSSMAEIDAAVARVKAVLVTLLQYILYPTPPEQVGLNLVPYFRDRYDCPVGLSDHSGTIYPGLAAATLGIDVLEVHVALSREMFGPDVPASITTTELRQLVDGIRFIETMRANPIDKNVMGESLAPMRDLFTKSVWRGLICQPARFCESPTWR